MMKNFGKPPDEFLDNASFHTRELLDRVFSDGLNGMIVDYHAHRLGFGNKSDEEFFLNPQQFDFHRPFKCSRGMFFTKAFGIRDNAINSEDLSRHVILTCINRLEKIVDGKGNRIPMKMCLFAFDKVYNLEGTVDWENTPFFVSNDRVFKDCRNYPEYFYPVISIHPYRPDALEEMKKCYQKGARMMKWLPNLMGIDPTSKRCEPLYDFMREHGIFLVSHCGTELAMYAQFQSLGNPQLLKKPLEMGVNVIAAHCASVGKNRDIEKEGMPHVRNFDLWVKMMQRYDGSNPGKGILYGDISCLTQVFRLGKIKRLLELKEFHDRIVNGSDWPWVEFGLTVSTLLMWLRGYISWNERLALNEIYQFNPLLFDYALKRVIKHPDDHTLSFPLSVFQLNEKLVPFSHEAIVRSL